MDQGSISTQAHQANPATDVCPTVEHATTKQNGTATSNGWLSRTAALVDGSKPNSHTATAAASASPATSKTPAVTSNIFHSPKKVMQKGTVRQEQTLPNGNASAANGQASAGHMAPGHMTPEGGQLVGSSNMADSHCGVVIALALCGDYVCSAAGDAMIKVWKADSLEFVRWAWCCTSKEELCRSS